MVDVFLRRPPQLDGISIGVMPTMPVVRWQTPRLPQCPVELAEGRQSKVPKAPPLNGRHAEPER